MLKFALLVALFAFPEFASQGEPRQAKSIYLDRAGPDVTGAACGIALLLEDDQTQSVTQTFEFKSGDRIRLECEVRKKSFVYVLNRTFIMDERDELFPTPVRLVFGPEQVETGARRQIPDGMFPMKFDDIAGIEEVKIVLSDRRLPDLESLFDLKTGALKSSSTHRSDTSKGALSNLDGESSYRENTYIQEPLANSKGVVVDRNDKLYAAGRVPYRPIEIIISLKHLR